MCYTSCHSGVRVLGLFLARGGGEVLRSMDLMLFHFAIEGPPRPVEPLRCPALVPVGGKQGGEEPVPLFHRLADGASRSTVAASSTPECEHVAAVGRPDTARKEKPIISVLARGLKELGVKGLTEAMTSDELDAVTAALVGRWFLLGKGEMLGSEQGIVMPSGDRKSKNLITNSSESM